MEKKILAKPSPLRSSPYGASAPTALSALGRRSSGVFKDYLTSYEKARLIGTRASQLSAGAEPLVEVLPGKNGFINFLDVAELEYKKGLIPINIIRVLPNGDSVRIKIKPKTA